MKRKMYLLFVMGVSDRPCPMAAAISVLPGRCLPKTEEMPDVLPVTAGKENFYSAGNPSDHRNLESEDRE